MMDTKQLAELLAKVTPGPWVNDRGIGIHADDGAVCVTVQSRDNYRSNAALIALAPDLAADVIRLTAERDAAVAVLREIAGKAPYHDDPWGIAHDFLAKLEAAQ